MIRVAFKLKKSVALAGLTLLSGALPAGYAAAQSYEAAGIPTPPGAVRMGPLEVYPSVRYEVQHNDNILLQAPGSGLVKSDNIQVLSPAVRAEAKHGPNSYAAGVAAQFGRYRESTADNYNTNNAFVSANLSPSDRVHMRLRADHVDAIDPRGTTTDPLTPTPNKYRQETLGGIFAYGAPGAKGRVEVELGRLDKRYYNNAASGVQRNNRDDNIVGGTFYWRVAPKTSLLAEVRHIGHVFRDKTVGLDGTDTTYYAGVTWRATALTTGIVKIGTEKAHFNDSSRTDTSSPSWSAQIRWQPLTYDQWDFRLSRAYRVTTPGVGDTVLNTTSSAIWNHKWTGQVTTTATGSYGVDDYKGLPGGRTDKMPSLGLRATYQMRRWLGFGADYTWSKRNSDAAGADYKDNVLMFFVNATL